MHDIMVKSLQPGVRLTAIFDSCHSGTALDLPYVYSTQGVLKEPNLAKEAGQGLLGIVSSYARGDMSGIASTAMGFFKKATTGDEVYERNKITKTSPADVIMWSGSKDTQTSYVHPFVLCSPEFCGSAADKTHTNTDQMPASLDKLQAQCLGPLSPLSRRIPSNPMSSSSIASARNWKATIHRSHSSAVATP